MSGFGNMAASGEWSWNQLTKDMPLASDINTIANKFIGCKNAEAVNDILNLLVQSGIGMNPQSLTDAAIAIIDACGDDPALSHEAAIFVMRVLQVPQSQLDKLYFDEIDLSGVEASKLTPAELAQRYAEYQVMRGTPLAPWSWGDEERMDKAMKSAQRKIKERINSLGDQEIIKAYADFEARYKNVAPKMAKAKKLMEDDYTDGAQAFAELQEMPDYMVYFKFQQYNPFLKHLCKMWLTASTSEEASLLATTIPEYRARLVQYLQADNKSDEEYAMNQIISLRNDFNAKYRDMQVNR